MVADTDAFIAANRFGLGPRPGELAAIGRDPRGWLRAQLTGAKKPPAELAGLPPATDAIAQPMLARQRSAPDRAVGPGLDAAAPACG